MFEFFLTPNFSFQNPEFLLLLGGLPFLALLYFLREYRGGNPYLKFSSLVVIKSLPGNAIKSLRHLPLFLRLITLALLIVALARPRLSNEKQSIYSEGIDIMLCIDLSTSMLAEDFEPKNRIEAAKEVARQFVQNRVTDRIGLVVFQAKAFTQCPLTLDYNLLNRFLAGLRAGLIAEDGTAIGTAIATATNRLRSSTAKSKVIILLTDGQNNAGEIEPQTAADLAATLGIKIYTVGAGTRGYANYPIDDPIYGRRYIRAKVDVDDVSLEKIAKTTGGKYFRATDLKSLQSTYREIDQLEKTKVEVETYTEYKEEFAPFVLAALMTFLLELLLVNTRFRRAP